MQSVQWTKLRRHQLRAVWRELPHGRLLPLRPLLSQGRHLPTCRHRDKRQHDRAHDWDIGTAGHGDKH